MARIFNSEKSQFIQQATQIYNQNKVGQYSKYLDSNPIFITYYSINMAQSRGAVGLGQIYDELGPSSPLRFNKITELPVYRVQQLQPQGNFEDGSYDVEIDISDMTILPNTVRPRPYDFFCVDLPGCKKLLFRVNNFRNNTIQSNDFYMVDADLRESGDNCCDAIERQVVETYHCVFENIGTQDNCFIKSSDESTAADVSKLIENLSGMYHDLFYDEVIGDYLFYPTNTNGFHHDIPTECYYDIYLAKFINDSMLFFTGDYAYTSVVTYDDTEPKLFDYIFKHTIWYALMTKKTNLLCRYPYYFARPISKTFSPILYHVDGRCYGFDLVIDSNTKQESPMLSEYFPHKLIASILDGDKVEEVKESDTDFNIVDLEYVAKSPKTVEASGPYITKAKNNTVNETIETSETTDTEADGTSYIYGMIKSYFNGESFTPDPDTIIAALYHYTLWSYHLVPVVIYILKAIHSGYFIASQ